MTCRLTPAASAGQSVHGNTSDLGGCCGALCVPSGGAQTRCVRGCSVWAGASGNAVDAPASPAREGLGVRATGHKGPATPHGAPSVMAQEHSWLVLRSRGLTRRRGAPPGSRSWLGLRVLTARIASGSGAELRGVVVGRGVQPMAGRPVAGSLQVALATGEKERRQRAS